jgi:immunity protein, SdpI family
MSDDAERGENGAQGNDGDLGGGGGAMWFSAIGIAATIVISVLAYPHLPPRMVVHWGLHGEPNGWADRSVGAFLVPALAVVLWVMMRWLPYTDPRFASYAKFRSAYTTVVNAAIAVLLIVHLLALAFALGWRVPMTLAVQVLVGALFVVVGIVLPDARRNRYVGFRTPWAMASDRVWERTQRVGGLAFIVAGLVMVVTSIIPPPAGFLIGIAAVLIASLLPMILSYLWWRAEQEK